MTLHQARTAARRARVRHDEFMDHLPAQGQSPTVEQRNRLDVLNADREAALDELEAVLRGMGVVA